MCFNFIYRHALFPLCIPNHRGWRRGGAATCSLKGARSRAEVLSHSAFKERPCSRRGLFVGKSRRQLSERSPLLTDGSGLLRRRDLLAAAGASRTCGDDAGAFCEPAGMSVKQTGHTASPRPCEIIHSRAVRLSNCHRLLFPARLFSTIVSFSFFFATLVF